MGCGEGCARFTTTQSDTSYDDLGKPLRTITTRASAVTFFEAKSALASFKATQTDKTQTAIVGGLNQEASSTNLTAGIQAVTKLVEALKMP